MHITVTVVTALHFFEQSIRTSWKLDAKLRYERRSYTKVAAAIMGGTVVIEIRMYVAVGPTGRTYSKCCYRSTWY